MHNAPSVTYPVGRCAFERRMVAVCLLASTVVLALWAWQQTVGIFWCLACLMLSLAARWAWRAGASVDGAAQQQTPAHLHWNGRAWLCQHDAHHMQDGDVRVVLDAQTTLLLQWKPLSATLSAGRWLWLSRDQRPADWQHLRRAVYGPR